MDKKQKAVIKAANDLNPAVMYRDFEDVGYYIGNTGKLFLSPVKRIKNVYPLIYDTHNMIYSQYTAQKGKKQSPALTMWLSLPMVDCLFSYD